jgi:hypothetical protein
LQQQAATVARFTIGKNSATVLHSGQCVNSSTHYLVARFAFYVGDQAETTVILLKGFIVQHISEPPPGSSGFPLNFTVAHRHRKSMATGFAFHTRTSHSPSFSSFRAGKQV